MLDASAIAAGFSQLAPEQLRAALENLLPEGSTAERVSAIEGTLRSPIGLSLREGMARWIVDEIVPVESLVPESYLKWRAPVREAMMYVVAHLSPGRLAPKLLEQIELPTNTSAEMRLLRLIAKVPGLQKLGQVIARNQHLRPALRTALAKLENGIRDVKPGDMRAVIEQGLGPKLKAFDVRIAPTILSEASVSAVVRFTWKNPEAGRRERGVFKVLKPHIPEYFAEDMDYLQGLAQYFGDRHHTYGFEADLIPDTFRKVERLLRHEVNFRREQKTLLEAQVLYRAITGIRIPRVIKALSTSTITALTEEAGAKVTSAASRLPSSGRQKLAEQLVEALIAVPLFAVTPDAIFHGDPHAGNLLYNNRTRELTIIDWALRERLNREQRRHLALLFLMVSLRDPLGTSHEIRALTQHQIPATSRRGRMIRMLATKFLEELPASHLPSGADAMRLLERVAIKGIKFPSSLIMLSKVMFTLEGILGDIVASEGGMAFTLARQIAQRWLSNRSRFRSPLRTRDWLTLQCSALLYTGRLWVKLEQAVFNRLPTRKQTTGSAMARPHA
ncbi:MAG TPA: AarF/UbiB family protein [Nitrospira sp.]|nr:AarF/UbiB family protein [Nitrospira sp.]